jgi:hypothetical protein
MSKLDAAKYFKDTLVEALKENPKTSWGKNELEVFIKDTYTDFIERYLE